MTKHLLLSLLIIATFSFWGCSKKDDPLRITYPKTHQDSTYDIYFGVKINDPYRWLENSNSETTKKWVQEQNKITDHYLAQIPYTSSLVSRLKHLWNYSRYSAPFKEGKEIYYYKNNGIQNFSVLYRKRTDGKDERFIDPNTFSKDATTSLSGVSFTHGGDLVAYLLSEGGADLQNVVVMDVYSKKILGDTLKNVKFSTIAWKGSDGFFYSSYGTLKDNPLVEKTTSHKLYYHKLGSPQSKDQVVFGHQKNNSFRYVNASITEDQQYLVISASNTTYGNKLYIQKLDHTNAPMIELVHDEKNEYAVIFSKEDSIFILTDRDAPNQKLIQCHYQNAQPSTWKTIIAEKVNMPLSVSTGAHHFFALYQKDASSVVMQYDLNGNLIKEIALPGVGTVSGFSGKQEDSSVYYTFTNYITPPSIFQYTPSTRSSILYKTPDLPFSVDDFISEKYFYTSKDGIKIPIIVSYKKGMKKNGKNPLLLYGYGGFNISILPSFSVSRMAWMERGGILAVANIRGGGEYGQKWHEDGTKMKKKNVFSDFITAGEYLIKGGYTSSDFLAIEGGSNGGLLVGACMTQRPDLFKVAIPRVGVLDMLRYQKFTAGAGWAYDYGTCDDSKDMFEYLLSYSPLHQLKHTCYPATLVMTADHDDRVVPAHSYKFISTLQSHQTCKRNPTLVSIETKAGHGAGKSIEMTIKEEANKWAFIWWNMGFKELPELE